MNDTTCLKDKNNLYKSSKRKMNILQHDIRNDSGMNPACNALLIISIASILGCGMAYAQPLEEVSADVLNFDGTFATMEIAWNDNDEASYYEAGCVSCMPNLSYTTSENSIILSNITPLADGNMLLYVLAYDDADEIISVKQVVVLLTQ